MPSNPFFCIHPRGFVIICEGKGERRLRTASSAERERERERERQRDREKEKQERGTRDGGAALTEAP